MLATNNIVPFKNVESQINQLKALDHEIKVLEAKAKALKDDLIAGHFAEHEEFVGSEGLVLATYKAQKTTRFDTTLFKADHADIYKMYSKESVVNVFRLVK